MAEKHAVVICTIARPIEVRAAIVSVLKQTLPPDLIIVVDGSGGTQIKEALEVFDRHDARDKLMIVPSASGLPLQRNLGMETAIQRLSETDLFVHFVDDDVILAPEYLYYILQAFRSDPLAVVVGGRDLERKKPKHGLISRILLTDSRDEGKILRSSFNVVCESPTMITAVDWVSGLSQSFRMETLGALRFDERIRFYGEEVDMHIRCSKVGSILWTPHAELRHAASAVGREHVRESTVETDAFKWNLCIRYPHRFSKILFLYSTIGHLIVKSLQGLIYSDSAAVEMARGHFSFLRALLR
jgi:GT2 family glycosyltransferase